MDHNLIPPETMQAIGQVEEIAIKATLVVLTLGACARFAIFDIIATYRGIDEERGRGKHKKPKVTRIESIEKSVEETARKEAEKL